VKNLTLISRVLGLGLVTQVLGLGFGLEAEVLVNITGPDIFAIKSVPNRAEILMFWAANFEGKDLKFLTQFYKLQ